MKHVLIACAMCALSAPALAEPTALPDRALGDVHAGALIEINVSPQITTAINNAITTQTAAAVAVLGSSANAVTTAVVGQINQIGRTTTIQR